jgi:alcohol dehydrogenase (cytochrome c)
VIREHTGYVKAFDPATGAEKWSWRTEHPVLGSVLATRGGLLFTGMATGEAIALDAATGRLLCNSRPRGISQQPRT